MVLACKLKPPGKLGFIDWAFGDSKEHIFSISPVGAKTEPVLFEEKHRCDKRRSLVPINESVIFAIPTA
jgi:hypothetical protein